MDNVADDLWVLRYPLNVLGGHQDRVVTVIRLADGRLILHSSAPFSPDDVRAIREVGEPAWLVEALLLHDTFAKEARAAFPDLPYLAPEGFAEAAGVDALPLLPPPPAWEGVVRVLLIDGMPKTREHVFLHVPSRTLIVGDLLFNFDETAGWTGFFRRRLVGVKEHPDAGRLYPHLIVDRAAYEASIRELLSWDFDRIVVGHNRIVEGDGRRKLAEALGRKRMLPRA